MHLCVNPKNKDLKKYKNYNDYELLYLLDWHSEEALYILMEKYDNLINAKLLKFNISSNCFNDFFQELRMSVLDAIRKYDDSYGKSLCRFLELVIERRIMRLLYNENHRPHSVSYLEETIVSSNGEILDEMIYEARLKEVKEIKLDNVKSSILNQVFIQGISVKEYAQKHNMSVKDVHNHIYLLRCKVKDKFNL